MTNAYIVIGGSISLTNVFPHSYPSSRLLSLGPVTWHGHVKPGSMVRIAISSGPVSNYHPHIFHLEMNIFWIKYLD